jgi:hypothetical protein
MESGGLMLLHRPVTDLVNKDPQERSKKDANHEGKNERLLPCHNHLIEAKASKGEDGYMGQMKDPCSGIDDPKT